MTFNNFKITVNFLSDSEFAALCEIVLPNAETNTNTKSVPRFNWMYNGLQVGREEFAEEEKRCKKVTNIELLPPNQQWCFYHPLWFGAYTSPLFPVFGALVNEIDPFALYRVQANFTVQQETIRRRSLFHIDAKGTDSVINMLNTSIFYLNTTNGPTILEDGTEIECRANRLVTYPYNTCHAGVLCTDEPYRIVVNLNYFKEIEW